MRLMSFALTTLAFYRRQKSVTRRLGWENVQVGELICGAERCQGLKKGESPTRLAIIRVNSVNREKVDRILHRPDDVALEGFTNMTADEFVAMFCLHHDCRPKEVITRIVFDYVPGGRFAVPGICRQCGCVDGQACHSEDHGPCWWVDSRGRPTGDSSLCSHCYHGWDCGIPDWQLGHEMESF